MRTQKEPSLAVELRGRAEAMATDVHARSVASADGVSFDLRAIVHELRVHEIELSMQNDELRRSQDDLAASRDAYRALYDDAPVGYLMLDPRSGVIESNTTAAAMLGIEVRRLRSIPLSSLMSRADADRLHVHLQEVAESGMHCTCELDIPSSGESSRQAVRLRLDSIVVGGGSNVSFRTTLTDVSERHSLEQQLRQLNDDLELRVHQRTVELRAAQERLVVAGKMEAIGRLAGGVAHDFNNLLTVIRLHTGMLRRQVAEREPAMRSLDDVERATACAAGLIRKLLAFARPDQAESGSSDPVQVIRGLKSILGGSIGADVSLALELEESGWVALDRPGLEQVIMNLVLNGRDAISDTGKIAIDVRRADRAHVALLHPDAASCDYVMIAVRDSGHGMDAATLGRAFEPFYTTKRGERGTGFGLATVYGVVTSAGGFIDLQSEIGRGTRAVVFLPRVNPGIATTVGDPDDDWRGGTETILVVDDDEQVRTVACKVVVLGGYTVLEAANGVDALALFEANRNTIDLVLTDIVMPGMSGIDLATTIAAADAFLPIVLMSGYAVERPVGTTWRVLQKPFAPEELLQELRRALDSDVARPRA